MGKDQFQMSFYKTCRSNHITFISSCNSYRLFKLANFSPKKIRSCSAGCQSNDSEKFIQPREKYLQCLKCYSISLAKKFDSVLE